MSADICRWLFLLFFLIAWIASTNSKEIRVVCYYTNWSVYRPGQAKFSPQNINPYLCTHLIYAFGGFTKENTLKPFDKYQDIEKGGYAKFTGLKTYNKNLKTMLAIGGWNEGSSRFSPMVANPERRKELVKNSVKFLRQNHFDGLDLDWEYPSFRDGGKSRDRDNYAKLVQELREEFDRESEKTGRTRLLLTMAVPAGIEYINKGYDVPKLTKYLDWMNILSYDYHSAFEPAVNHHAPLYSLEEESEYNYDSDLNIDHTIKHYLEMGAEPSKLVMGIPTYGRSYTLFNPDANELGAPADGPGDMGDATRENGYLAYYEICENIKSQDWEVVEPNPNAMGPYAYKDNQWVGYDDETIARKKAEYVAENGLGGIMFWSIDNDDFRGGCHGKPYPIIEAAKEALVTAFGHTENVVSPTVKPLKTRTRTRVSSKSNSKKDEESNETKPSLASSGGARRRNRIRSSSSADRLKSRRKESKSTTESAQESATHSSLKVVTPSYTTPAPPSTPDQGGVFKCEDEGFYPHPKDCKKYYWCLSGPGELGIIAHQFTCPAGLYFNKAADSCDYTRNVLCKKPKSTTTTTEGSTSQTTTTAPPSTSRVPPKITAATSRTTQFRTSTTTEASYEDEYEYEDDDNVEGRNAEEDPKVIKELLDLIRKAGGIEELEKQLKIHDDGTASISSSSDVTTQSSISKSLVQRVLNKAGRNNNTVAKNNKINPRYNFLNRNSRGPQNEGLSKQEEELSEKKTEKSRLQYTTISRQRPSTSKPKDDLEDELENEENDDKDIDKNSDAEKTTKASSRRISYPQYVNIQRGRSSTTTEEAEEDSETKIQLNRNKILGEEGEDDEEEKEETDSTSKRQLVTTPQYISIRRQKPSTTEESTNSKYTVIRRGTTTEASAQNEETETTLKPKRRGSTSTQEVPTTTSEETVFRRSTISPLLEDEPSIQSNKLLNKYKTVTRSTTTEASIKEISTTSEESVNDLPKTRSSTSKSEVLLPVTTTKAVSTSESSSAINIQTIKPNKSDNSETTKLSNEEQTTIENKLTETNKDLTTERRTPLLLEPRPFSIYSRKTTIKPKTETTTTTRVPKVSEPNSRFGVRSTTTENSNIATNQRTRRPSRFNQVSTTSDYSDHQSTRSTLNPSLRAKKRFSTTTEEYRDEEFDVNRTFRPLGIDDLSSLTAVDFAGVNSGRFGGNFRQRRPRPTSAPTQKVEETRRTSSQTLPIAKKNFDNSDNRRNEKQTKNNLDLSTGRKVEDNSRRKSLSNETSTEGVRAFNKNRRIIRRFRPTSSTSTTTQKMPESTENIRKRLTKPTTVFPISQKFEATSPNSISNTTTENHLTASSTTPTSFKEEKSEDLITLTPLPYVLERNKQISGILDSINKEEDEEENIKLSESNINENNDVNNGNVILDDGKVRAKVLKRIKSKNNDDVDTSKMSTEPNIIVRTRKIVRKLKPTESIPISSSTTTTTESSGRKRKIIRRLRPTPATTGELPENSNRPNYKSRSTTVATNTENLTEDKEEAKNFKTNRKPVYKFLSRSSTPQSVDLEDEDYEEEKPIDKEIIKKQFKSVLNKSIYKSSTSESFDEENGETGRTLKIDRSKYKTILRSTTKNIIDESNDDDDDENEETTSQIQYSHDEDENIDEAVDEEENPVENTENGSSTASYKSSSIKYRIYRPNLSKNTENEDDNLDDSALRITLPIPSIDKKEETIDNFESSTESIEFSTVADEDEINTTTTSTTTYRNPILDKQKNRPVYIRPKSTKAPLARSSTDSSINRPKYKQFGRSTTATPSTERNSQKKINRTRYSTISRTTEPIVIAASATTTTAATTTINISTSSSSSTTENAFKESTTENIESSSFRDITDKIGTEENTDEIILASTEQKIGTTTEYSTTISENDEITTFDKSLINNLLLETTTENFVIENKYNFDESTKPEFTDKTNQNDQSTTSSTNIDATTEESTTEKISTTVATTTTFLPRSTLRSIQSRPKFFLPKQLAATDLSKRKNFNENRARPREINSPSSTTENALPKQNIATKRIPPSFKNRFSYNKFQTTEKIKIEDDNIKEDSEDYDEENDKAIKSSTTLRNKNKPSTSFSFRKTTESPKVVQDLSDINKEAVKNRNKSLFAKKRKMNTPFAGSVTSITNQDKITTPILITESITKSAPLIPETTTEFFTTLHHVFAETEPFGETTTQLAENATIKDPAKSKIERLIEVNRIVEVHDAKNKENKILDKIGAINRVTVIKVVDGNSTNDTNTLENEINRLNIKPAIKLNINGAFIVPEIAIDNKNSDRQEKKYEIYGDSKVLDYSQINGLKQFAKNPGKINLIENTSGLINIITPRPSYSTEASTIALEGLFQTDSPQIKSFKSNNYFNNDELLETDNSRYVNVRILEQDKSSRNEKTVRDDTSIIPIKVLPQDDEITMKAQVVEITPRSKEDTIKIVPIKVEMSKRLLNSNSSDIGNFGFKSNVDSGIPKVDLTVIH